MIYPLETRSYIGIYADSTAFAGHIEKLLTMVSEGLGRNVNLKVQFEREFASCTLEDLEQVTKKSQLKPNFASHVCHNLSRALLQIDQTWLPHSKSYPGLLHSILLHLEPISAAAVLNLWDSAETKWCQDQSRSFFVSFFGENGYQIRTFLVQQVEKLWGESNLCILNDLNVL